MDKVWTERKIYTECDQEAIIQPNENFDGIVLWVSEEGEKKESARLYLSYDEAITLAEQLIGFVKENKE